MSFNHGVNMDYLPLLAVELEDSKLWLENFELALRCWYAIFLDRFTVSFKVYRGFVRILGLQWKLVARVQI